MEMNKSSFFRNLEASLKLYQVDAYHEISSKQQRRREFEELMGNILDDIFMDRHEDIKNNFSLVRNSIKIKSILKDAMREEKKKKKCC